MQLDALFRPRSIAIIGASEKPTIGRRLITSLDRLGFTGQIFPINPNYPAVLGRKCYASIADTPEPPDVAAFCVGHRLVLDAFVAAAERGVRAAVIYDGGFAERGTGGLELQRKITGICRDAGIALCGPNCMGILNPIERNTTYLQEIRDPLGLVGNVGIVSQSGGLCVSLLTDVSRFGFSHIVSCGNEAVLNAADFLEYLVDDPHTAAIGGFIECVRAPERFVAALDRAALRDKPVVMLKVGQSARAGRAVLSHTAGDAGDPALFSDMLRAHRAIEVRDLAELTEILAAVQGARRPPGRRIGIVTSSGGLAELMLDIAAAADLRLPPLPADLRADLDSQVGYVTGRWISRKRRSITCSSSPARRRRATSRITCSTPGPARSTRRMSRACAPPASRSSPGSARGSARSTNWRAGAAGNQTRPKVPSAAEGETVPFRHGTRYTPQVS